ncbi:hypothetical protein GCM10007938_19970 [Vibrio zhanjiangensis]|uniref:Bacterial OB-fold domain-containing protein n=1 Tax=Vibrio zhanjiangensis TaxID=1046128 RepID=A0ABQ6EZ00_9VIBR|nr:NirD/YgiW/YdeI family stress tolerance protein [Vibrio zhanjiangensis]GLT18219.1 hypothetical protein GCM10007938_19970 [Vibrio zhanjiangensis]
MKSKIIVSILALSASATLYAQGFKGPQSNAGFNGPNLGIATVQQALDASDDTPVTLTGKIIASLGGEMYTFTDGTGEIPVEIDHDKWLGQEATHETQIQISGEVDKELLGSPKIDVDVVRVL